MPNEIDNYEIDATNSAEAYHSVLTWIDSVPDPKVNLPRVDRMQAVSPVLKLDRLVKQPEIAAAFATLPQTSFDPLILKRLKPLALAVWHQANLINDQNTLESQAKLPAALAEEATKMRNRLLSLVNYYLSDDPAIAPRLAGIKSGNGYLDLASDLKRLGVLIAEFRSRLELDPRNYTATCSEDATQMADRIIVALNSNNPVKQQRTQLYNRLWQLLCFYYNEVCATGSWLFRNTSLADRFVSLTLAVRKTKPRKANDNDDESKDEKKDAADAD